MSAAHRRGKINRERGWSEDIPPIPVSKIDAELYGALREAEGDNALLINNQIHIGSFTLTPTGLEIAENASRDEWEKLGELLFRLEGSIQWLLGDWLVYGADLKWGDLERLASDMNRDYQTLRDYMVVSRKIPLSLRNYNLSYNHYRAVTSLEQQKQADALAYAEEHKLSVAAFRKWLRGALPENTSGPSSQVIFEPKAGTFYQLLRSNKEEARAYLRQVHWWADAMEEQHFRDENND